MKYLASDLLEVEIYSCIKDTKGIGNSINLDTNLSGMLELSSDSISLNANLDLDRIKNSINSRIFIFNYRGKTYDLQIFYSKPFNERYKVFCCGQPIEVIFDETDFFYVLNQKEDTHSKNFAKDIYCYITRLKNEI